ncbi:MAG: hypothetical protein A3G21_21835 [Acidobacteria bacterium RIFCSPLOWO2_12_FULL_66_21]|nr:MAG: hypothetical protein A3G21_21835 [Acidobacteria bacterium RIFCSPLOWO2_12_FULL_66_21]
MRVGNQRRNRQVATWRDAAICRDGAVGIPGLSRAERVCYTRSCTRTTMSDPVPAERRLLRSWKSIAAHLEVDVRTAQRWHKKTPLPLHRPSLERSHPVVYADELDRWIRESDVRGQTAPERARRGGRRALAAAVIVVAIALAGGAYILRPERAGEPHRAVIDGGVVSVLDARDRECWRRTVEGASGAPIVEDVDGDGRKEVLVDVAASASGATSGRLQCFDANGRERWTFVYGRARSWYGREFSATYGGRFARHIRTPRGHAVLAVAWHNLWFPAQVALIDSASGALAAEYWHPGGLRELAVMNLDGDEFDEVLLAGINNPGRGLGHGVLVALDVPFTSRELAYVVLPRPDACSVLGEIPFVNRLANEGANVVAGVRCGDATWLYTFNRALELVEMRPSDNVTALHRRLHQQGLLDHELGDEEEACLRHVAWFPTAPDGNSASLARLWAKCE